MESRTTEPLMGKERILLVDDERSFLFALRSNISFIGFDADIAGNGEEAQDLLEKEKYDVLITDLVMPKMDGMELMAATREKFPGTDILVMSACGDQYNFSDIISAGAIDFIAKPFSIDELKAKLQRIFRERRLLESLEESKNREKLFLIHLVESLVISLEEKDRYTHGHSRRVTNLSLQLAEHVITEEEDFELLRLCGMLHDIGKIGVPEGILNKAYDLSEAEQEIIMKHPVQGARILQPVESEEMGTKISKVIRHHHEHYDGQGYPDGLKGDNIPLYSRIIAIADSFDAMTSDRPYRKGLNAEKALNEIERNIGSQFDPALAQVFINMVREQHNRDDCAKLSECAIFKNKTDSSKYKVFKMHYCRANFKACERYKKKSPPENLLPDGTIEHN